jgi:uncharacterized membrane protein YdcZ (DUF606 family)
MFSDTMKLAGAAILVFLAGILGIYIFGSIWSRIGIGAAIVIVVGGLLFWAWRVDKRDRASREGLERV